MSIYVSCSAPIGRKNSVVWGTGMGKSASYFGDIPIRLPLGHNLEISFNLVLSFTPSAPRFDNSLVISGRG